jgi:hypothetical protein
MTSILPSHKYGIEYIEHCSVRAADEQHRRRPYIERQVFLRLSEAYPSAKLGSHGLGACQRERGAKDSQGYQSPVQLYLTEHPYGRVTG